MDWGKGWKSGAGTPGLSASSAEAYAAPLQEAANSSWGGAYSTGPGLQGGQAQSQLSSLNSAGPGAAESYYGSNQNVWQSPSFGEVNNQGLVGTYSDPSNRPQTTQHSQDWFNHVAGAMPSINSDPGFGAYFENAKNRAAESINQAMAARGAYGSSAANDQTARAFTDLEGQRALKEADYNLARLGEQRAWEGLGGQLAGQADTNSLAGSQNEQNWANLLSRMGIDASQLGLQRTNAGMDAAAVAQGAQRGRGNDYFNQQLLKGDRLADLYKSTILPGLDNDATMMSEASSGRVAQGNQAANNERTNAQDTVSLGNTFASLYGAFK